MKSFGPKGQAVQPVPREPFQFTFLRDDEPETHEFQARAITDVTGLSVLFQDIDRHPERALTGMMRQIAKLLDNKDGVSASWQPAALPLPSMEDRVASGTYSEADDEEEQVMKFRTPAGDLLPLTPENTAKFTDHAAGSSRRRWLELIEGDVTVHESDLVKLFQWLVGLAGKGRTAPSA